jgi:two-component system sensor histidine kinase KdpD
VLLTVVASALLGGVRVALPGAVVGVLVLDWYFTPPYDTFDVAGSEQVVVLGVFLAVAVAVSAVTGLAVRRSAEAALARAEAQALSSLAGAALSKQETLPGLLERIRTMFGMSEVALLEQGDGHWSVVEIASAATGPDETEQRVAAGPTLELRLRGPELLGRDQRLLSSFAEAAATAMEGRRLAQRAAEAAAFEAADRTRAALLAAVGHDLRTPLAALKAASGSLRQEDVTWTPEETDELLATVEESADTLQALVENLLDASRLEAGVVSVHLERVGLQELVDRAVVGLSGRERLHLDVPDELPDLLADPGLAERVLANLIQNALRYSPAGTIVSITGGVTGAAVHCDVVDHGPGLPREKWGALFTPFQRLGDRSPGGVGLGLAVASGFAHAMGGAVTPAQTQGGGLTMRFTLPLAAAPSGRPA